VLLRKFPGKTNTWGQI